MKTQLLLLALLISTACHDSNEGSFGYAMAKDEFEEIPATMQPLPREVAAPAQISKKIIKTGGINFQSENIEVDYKKISSLLPGFNAYIENENQSKSPQRIDQNLTIRVPSESYDSLFSSLSKLAFRLDNRYSNIEDVTERYYDLQTRIENKKVLEQRYLELLKKASDVKDILEIERNLNEVRIDIENFQGQLNYLSKQVSLSSINLSFYEILPYAYDSSTRKGFGARILSAMDSGWQGFLSFIVGTVTLWPLAILIIGGLFLYRKFRSKRKNA